MLALGVGAAVQVDGGKQGGPVLGHHVVGLAIGGFRGGQILVVDRDLLLEAVQDRVIEH